jgi:hypothetical protein
VKPYVKVLRLSNSPPPPLRLRASDSLQLCGFVIVKMRWEKNGKKEIKENEKERKT